MMISIPELDNLKKIDRASYVSRHFRANVDFGEMILL